MGADLFKKVAAAAHLKNRNFKKPDKVPYTYDQKPFNLDGRINLDISFNGLFMCTPVYVKVDAQNPLLLSEGVCCQLGIIAYHPSIELPDMQKSMEKPPPPPPTVRNFKKADKVLYAYEQKSFNLDGRIDLDISFDGLSMCTPVYVKMDAQDPMLLSEGVCRQLGIIAYHTSIELPTVQKSNEKPPPPPPRKGPYCLCPIDWTAESGWEWPPK